MVIKIRADATRIQITAIIWKNRDFRKNGLLPSFRTTGLSLSLEGRGLGGGWPDGFLNKLKYSLYIFEDLIFPKS
jgi:hypothetical protein